METFSLAGFDVEQLVGFGASGEVWRARERATGEIVALKRLRVGDAAMDAESQRQLRRSAALLATVRHEHVVHVRATVPSPTGLVLVLDYAEGGSLAALLAARGVLSAGEVVAIAAPLSAALAQVHARGVVHGGITPANVLFDGAGTPLLADLGVARLAGGADVENDGGPAADVRDLARVCRAALGGSAAGRGGVAVPPALLEAVEAAQHPDPRSRPDAAGFARALYAACTPRPIVLARAVDAPSIAEPAQIVLPSAVVPPDTPTESARAPEPRGGGRHRLSRRVAGDRFGGSRLAARRLTARRLALPLAAAGLLAIAVLAGLAWAARDRPASASAQLTGTPTPTDSTWSRVMGALDAARDRAFADANPAELAGVYVAGSAALAADRQTLATMAAAGGRARDLRLTLVSVQVKAQSPTSVDLLVRDTLPPYEIVDGDGVAQVEPGRGERDWLVTLRATAPGGSWRISSIAAA